MHFTMLCRQYVCDCVQITCKLLTGLPALGGESCCCPFGRRWSECCKACASRRPPWCQEKWIFPVTSKRPQPQEMEIGMFERRFIDSSKNWMIQRRDFVQARRPAHDYPSKRATQISLSNLMNSYLQCHAVRRYWLGFKIRLEFGSYFSLKWWPNVRLWGERERGSCHFTWTECMVEKSRTSDDFWSVKVHSAAF